MTELANQIRDLPRDPPIFDWPIPSCECFLEFSCVNGLAKDCKRTAVKQGG